MAQESEEEKKVDVEEPQVEPEVDIEMIEPSKIN